jgi:hypothetical protein
MDGHEQRRGKRWLFVLHSRCRDEANQSRPLTRNNCAQTRPERVGRGFQSRREHGTNSCPVSVSRRYYPGLVMA